MSSTELDATRSYDVASVRIRAVDQNGNVIPYFSEPVRLKAEGAVELIGPRHVPFRGGMTGCYVKTVKGQGTSGKLIIKADVGKKIKKEIIFTVSTDGAGLWSNRAGIINEEDGQ